MRTNPLSGRGELTKWSDHERGEKCEWNTAGVTAAATAAAPDLGGRIFDYCILT